MNQLKARLFFVCLLLGLAGAVVVTRLFAIQILDYKRYSERSRNQTQLRHILTAKRGTIYDRTGAVLSVTMEDKISLKPEAFGVVAKRKGQQAVNRVYPLGEITGPVVGYVGKDGYGLGGAEFAYDSRLRGEDGWIILQKDGRNNRYKKIGLPEKEPENGSDVYLTIDADIQKIIQTVLKQTVETFKAKGGMCIVMDPHTGKILGMANEPSFNPNIPSQFSLADRQNKCISYTFEPGSTFKVVTAATALQENIKREDDIIYGNNGVFEIYNQVIRDHDPYGYLTFTKALSYSSNVCFAKIANEIGNDKLYNYTRDFGFGIKSGIDLPGEEDGILHPVNRWSGRTRVTMAIGQELTATLLQMTTAFAAVANGGILLKPVICEKIIDNKGTATDTAVLKPVRRIMSNDVASRLRIMLKDVASDGTGKKASIDDITVAGKTGTAQKPDSGKYSKWRSWSSFIGFVPAEEPVLLCSVVIDEPAGGEMGGVAAAPAFKKIMTQIISHPELEFAEKILKKNMVPDIDKKEIQGTVPLICGLTKDRAVQVLDSLGLRYQFAGTGNSITFQAPSSGIKIDKTRILTLYLDNELKSDELTVPDCVGKDLRDAINIVNLKGFTPHVVGFGRVRKQIPAGGSLIHTTEVCTLICSTKG